jgi:ferric-dicitrate binding protein FerR (iron transport regulator)
MPADPKPCATSSGDAIWAEAWAWVRRQHDLSLAGAPPEQVAPQELLTWLASDPAHRDAYDKACRLWLATGLVPLDDEDAPDFKSWKAPT